MKQLILLPTNWAIQKAVRQKKSEGGVLEYGLLNHWKE
jgi:hypothetical protein